MARLALLLLAGLWPLLLQSLPSNADTTGNILSGTSWTGCGTTGENTWGGTSGGGNSPHCGSSQIIWGYGGGIINKTVAINEALQEVGIQVDGYSYVWEVKNANANDTSPNQMSKQDPLIVSVDIYKANGDLYQSYEYDYSYYITDWTTFSGSETFSDQYLDPAFFGNLNLSVSGDDAGYWAGHWGPEFRNPSVTLTYSSNPCYPDPLYDPQCSGYAEAYALKMLEEQMAAIETTSEPVIQEQTYEEPIVIQDTNNSKAQASTNGQINGKIEISTSERASDEKETKVDPIGIAINSAADDAAFILNNIVNGELGGISNALENNQTQTSMGMGNAQTQGQGSSSSNQNDSEERETQGQKLKRAAKERAAGLQQQIVESDDIDEQQAQQQEMLAMMNYVPGFDTYKIALAGGMYPDVAFYAPTTIPDSKEGARNNFAQQLLHQQMVDIQYQ